MKILLHSYAITKRGDSISLQTYAKALKKYYEIECEIVYDKNNENNSIESINNLINQGLSLYSYEDIDDLNFYAEKNNFDLVYWIKSGENDGKYVRNCKNVIHAVFNQVSPHGDAYAYVSEWLAKTAFTNYKSRLVNVYRNSKNVFRSNFSEYSIKNTLTCTFSNLIKPFEFVPHIIDLPNSNINFRQKYGISNNAFVIGRIGGYSEFNIEFVKITINKILNDDKNNILIFVNTEPFISHDRVLFINNYIDENEKASFISSCDMMLHARMMGETFGFSIAEALSMNVPIAACTIGHDKNHLYLLESTGLLYNNSEELFNIYLSIKYKYYKSIDLKEKVIDFTPEKVAEKFKNVFLNF
jgi:glycosyltransferase involved in cell wall biosynthesis